jgi:hypothetical protein
MFYPDSFKSECRRLYPDWQELHKMVEDGNVFAGRLLDDAAEGSVSLDTILHAMSLSELQELAQLEKEKVVLYDRWMGLYRGQGQVT